MIRGTTTIDDAAVLKLLGRIPAAAEGAQREVVGNLGSEWLGALKGETPRGQGENSPQMVRNYEVEQRYSPGAASYSITNETSYLKYVLNGRPEVVAVNGKALRFSIGGVVYFRKRVKAAKANNFPKRVRAKMQGRIDEAKRRLVDAIIRRARG